MSFSAERKMRTLLTRAFLILGLSFLLASCGVKRVEIPTYEGIDPREVLSGREPIIFIHSTFSVEFEREGNVMRGDAVLQLGPEALDLRIYSLGFLAAEVTADGSGARSVPHIEKNRLSMLVDGIRSSFFWWSVRNASIHEEDTSYLVSNSWKKLFINKKTMMPEKQVVELEGGRQLKILYEEPELMEGGWFPSKMRIELSSQAVNLRIRTLSTSSPR